MARRVGRRTFTLSRVLYKPDSGETVCTVTEKLLQKPSPSGTVLCIHMTVDSDSLINLLAVMHGTEVQMGGTEEEHGFNFGNSISVPCYSNERLWPLRLTCQRPLHRRAAPPSRTLASEKRGAAARTRSSSSPLPIPLHIPAA